MNEVTTSFRVINVTRGEIEAELHTFENARDRARQLAKDCDYKEVFAVTMTVTVYETKLKDPRRTGTDR